MISLRAWAAPYPVRIPGSPPVIVGQFVREACFRRVGGAVPGRSAGQSMRKVRSHARRRQRESKDFNAVVRRRGDRQEIGGGVLSRV